MKPDLLTRLVFNDSVAVEISSDYKNSVMVEVVRTNDPEDEGRQFHLEPDEIDLFVAALNLYKKRLEERRK
jgi:hypothetical protein